jgi:hypothetical protein
MKAAAVIMVIIAIIGLIYGIWNVMSSYDDMKAAESDVADAERKVYEEGRKLGMTDEEITADLQSKGLK